jgi:hypothetical protein
MRSIITLLLLSFLYLMNGNAQDRNCATMDVMEQQIKENPSLLKNMEEIERQTREFLRKYPDGTGTRNVITIPVVFHVVYNTTSENISDAQIQSQLDVLNADFRSLNSDVSQTPSDFAGVVADVQIEFCLATQDPSGNATTGITRKFTTNTSWGTSSALKNSSQGGTSPWNPSNYLNIWVCNIGNGILGYATLPVVVSPTLDGVVLDYRYTGTIGTATAPYHKGRTATHEVGHWLNLLHIWGDATCGNDQVVDTPVHNTSNGGCPVHPHYSTCTGNPVEMTMNYMDYTFDACMYMFTNGQKARMRAVLEGGTRASLLTSPGCLPPNPNTCNAPANLVTSNATSNSFTADWGAVSNATSYTFEYKLSTASTWITQNVNTTFIEITGLNSGSTYNTRVRANCSSGSSAYSNIVNVITSSPLPCTAPTGLAVSGISYANVTVNWNPVAPAVSYDLEYKLKSASVWTIVNVAGPPFNLTGLTPAKDYNVRIKTNCSGNSSGYSNTVNFKTANAPACNKPSNPVISNISQTTATATWSTVNGAVAYSFEYKLSSVSTWTAVVVTTNTYNLSGLNGSTTYNTRVKTICDVNQSSYTSTISFTTTAAPACNTPSGLNASNVGETSATASWNAVSGAVSYNLEYKASTATTWTVINTSNTSVELSGLSWLTTYNLRVRTNCAANTSAYSTTVNFTTTAPPGFCNDTYESNNTLSAGKPIAVSTLVKAKIGVSGDVDWFNFKNTSGQRNIRVTLSNLPADYNIRLYRGSSLVASSSNSGTDNEVIIFNTTTKNTTYNIEIFGVGGAFDDFYCYDLFVEISGTPFRLSGVGEEQEPIFAKDEMIVVPNPANEFITVILPFGDEESSGDLTILDMTGRAVYNQKVSLSEDIHKYAVDVSFFKAGVYLVLFRSETEVFMKKLMVSGE